MRNKVRQRTRRFSIGLVVLAIGMTALVLGQTLVGCSDRQELKPMTASDGMNANIGDTNLQVATFGAGCFWGVEATFRQTEGVRQTAVGYAGGSVENPTYEQVCSDRTGHAEVVQVKFDPAVVSYDQLLDVFFKGHDPTQLNRQGPDVGNQYRSIVFYHSDQQKAAAEAAIQHHQPRFGRDIVTAVEPAPTFWRAEEYHQQYLEKRGLSSCHSGISD
jgi:peptide-methionine (S)-S-oxide reductase